jgi:hypothetical protein
MDRPPPNVVKSRRGEIRLRYARDNRRKRGQHSYNTQFAAIRIAELNTLIEHWYGGPLPRDKHGRILVEVVAMHFMHLKGRPRDRLDAWAPTYAPWLTIPERDSIISRYSGRPPVRWKADTLARKIHLTMADRTACRITTIGATDCDKEERAALRKQKAREYQKARRATRRMLKSLTQP